MGKIVLSLLSCTFGALALTGGAFAKSNQIVLDAGFSLSDPLAPYEEDAKARDKATFLL